jgi:hypothetical protein
MDKVEEFSNTLGENIVCEKIAGMYVCIGNAHR